jgi:hypothetical protein
MTTQPLSNEAMMTSLLLELLRLKRRELGAAQELPRRRADFTNALANTAAKAKRSQAVRSARVAVDRPQQDIERPGDTTSSMITIRKAAMLRGRAPSEAMMFSTVACRVCWHDEVLKHTKQCEGRQQRMTSKPSPRYERNLALRYVGG